MYSDIAFDIQFPSKSDLVNFTSNTSNMELASIIIPNGLLHARADESKIITHINTKYNLFFNCTLGNTLPIVNILFNNLQEFLEADNVR